MISSYSYRRDKNSCNKKVSNTTDRDKYFEKVLNLTRRYAEDKFIMGSYFWSWSDGIEAFNKNCALWTPNNSRPNGDATDVDQGKFSVYESDNSTFAVIEKAVKSMNELPINGNIERFSKS